MTIQRFTAGRPSRLRLQRRDQTGALLVELVAAMGILVLVTLPLGFSIGQEQRVLRAQYYRAVAMEIVDGEMEVLVAGDWQTARPGTHPYTVKAAAARNLPPGGFRLTVTGTKLRLEWRPEKLGRAAPVVRETTVR